MKGDRIARGKTFSAQITGLPQGGIFQPHEQLDYDSDWRKKLGDAYANKVQARFICLCKGKPDDLTLRRLVVRYLKDSDRYSLSGWKHSGSQHRQDCRFYSVWPDDTSAGAYSSGVVRVNNDGT